MRSVACAVVLMVAVAVSAADLPRTGVTPQQIVDQLRAELAPAIRFALILMLDWYENDVDAGVHGAIAWLVGRWGQAAQSGDVHDDIEDTVRVVSDADARTRRGGAFPYEAAMARSAARGTVTSLPVQRRDNVGFRIARTLK